LGAVIGWGSTIKTTVSDQLQAVVLPYINSETCQKIFKDTIIGKYMNGDLCAGYLDGNNKNACQGDSGGPLIIDGRQAGIVSMGHGCGHPNSPVLFTDVAYYNKWILEQISL
jgi:trypsin